MEGVRVGMAAASKAVWPTADRIAACFLISVRTCMPCTVRICMCTCLCLQVTLVRSLPLVLCASSTAKRTSSSSAMVGAQLQVDPFPLGRFLRMTGVYQLQLLLEWAVVWPRDACSLRRLDEAFSYHQESAPTRITAESIPAAMLLTFAVLTSTEAESIFASCSLAIYNFRGVHCTAGCSFPFFLHRVTRSGRVHVQASILLWRKWRVCTRHTHWWSRCGCMETPHR